MLVVRPTGGVLPAQFTRAPIDMGSSLLIRSALAVSHPAMLTAVFDLVSHLRAGIAPGVTGTGSRLSLRNCSAPNSH